MNSNFIREQLKESEQFRLIFAKNGVLEDAILALQGSTTDAGDYLYIFDDIERDYDFEELLSKELVQRNYEISSTEDMRVPAGNELEWISEEIRKIDLDIEDFRGIWGERILPNIFEEYGYSSFEQINETWMTYLLHHQNSLFDKIIERFRENEMRKVQFIENLEKELIPFQEMAQKLSEIEEVEKNWGRELNRIIYTEVYNNSFYGDFVNNKQYILQKHSNNLNEREKELLNEFFNRLCGELDVI